MKPLHKKRLLKLADFLDELPRKKFNFAHVIAERDEKGCGTICCAIGWCPAAFPRLIGWFDERFSNGLFDDIAGDIFGVRSKDADYLFSPLGSNLGYAATPKQVAAHIRKFVKGSE